MLKTILQRWWAGGRGEHASSTVYVPPPAPPVDIECVPPFQQGLPAADPRRLLAPQWEIVRSIQHTLALERRDFERLVLPVIVRYAAFVHLLPASERHHHRLAGGLLCHGLEVAYWAARAAEGIVFAGGGTPLERKSLEPRWRTAVCFAGLLHDLGKAAAGVSVTNGDGTLTWNANRGSLYDWARAHKLARYYLRWRANQHRDNEHLSVFLAHHILTDDSFDWLNEAGREIMQAVFETIGGTATPENRFTRLVTAADAESVQRDLSSPHYGGSQDSLHEVPADRYVLEVMRRLLASGEWHVNQRGARVWRTNHGLFIVWKQACDDMHRLLARDRPPGIPHDPSALAQILFERDLAIPYINSDGDRHPTWPVAPQLLDTSDGQRVVLQMLKLSDPHLLFSSELPAAVPTHIDNAPLPVGSSGAPGPPSAERTAREPAAHLEPATAGSSRRMVTVPEAPPESPTKGAAPASPKRRRERARPPIPRARRPSASLCDMGPGPSPPPSASDDALPREELVPLAAATVDVSLPGRAGEFLIAMARDIATGRRAWGEVLALVGTDVMVRYPDAITDYGDPAEILKALGEAGWLTLDPLSPLKKVLEREGIRGLVLTQGPAAAVIGLTRTPPARTAVVSNGSPPHDGPRAPLRQPESATEQAADQAASLVELVRLRDLQIQDTVSEEGAWLRVPRSVLSSFLRTHPSAISLAQLRIAIEQRHDVRLDTDYLYVRKPEPKDDVAVRK